MTGWHVSEVLAADYAADRASELDAWSLEKHVESCQECAARVSWHVAAGSDGAVVADVRAMVLAEAQAYGRPGRFGSMVRVYWAVGPALRGPWLLALLFVIAGTFGLAFGAGYAHARPVLLALAPTLPLAGVALSYGRHADPMYDLVASTPASGLYLLLARTAVVLAVSIPLLTAAGALLPADAGGPGLATWLLPALALTLAALALGSYVGCYVAASILAACWTAAVMAPRFDALSMNLSDRLDLLVSGTGAQSGWAIGAAVCAGVLVLRRASFDYRENL
ncbi:zf-HC2 domain-containing protein [Streptomyces sp. NPDC057382]|uniref:zf-HC2 domain-containing protein n=1 Tax=unclassified Streptomyces TaxID=2593676 RepID=UPI003632D5B7